jgi:hypothetical protein
VAFTCDSNLLCGHNAVTSESWVKPYEPVIEQVTAPGLEFVHVEMRPEGPPVARPGRHRVFDGRSAAMDQARRAGTSIGILTFTAAPITHVCDLCPPGYNRTEQIQYGRQAGFPLLTELDYRTYNIIGSGKWTTFLPIDHPTT